MVANAVGSNIFLLTLTLGLAAVAAPVVADAQTLRFDVPVMIGSALLLWLLLLRQRLHWRAGLLLLLLYAGYLAYQFVGEIRPWPLDERLFWRASVYVKKML